MTCGARASASGGARVWTRRFGGDKGGAAGSIAGRRGAYGNVVRQYWLDTDYPPRWRARSGLVLCLVSTARGVRLVQTAVTVGKR